MRSAVDEYFVSAATKFPVDYRAIYESEGAILKRFDVRVIARGARVIQHDSIVRCAANGAGGRGLKAVFPLAAACVGDLQDGHDDLIELRNQHVVTAGKQMIDNSRD